MTEIYRLKVKTLSGQEKVLADYRDKAVLFVNVASECGFTPQYEGLQKLHQRYASKGLVVAGFPCNQFGGQEPGSSEQIRNFCSSKFGVEFPMFDKIEVNGPGRHPLYAHLTHAPDPAGVAGDVKWNFEKFLVYPKAAKVERFRSKTTPESPELVAAIERALASA